jgi:hypothetical protein
MVGLNNGSKLAISILNQRVKDRTSRRRNEQRNRKRREKMTKNRTEIEEK